MESPSHGEPLGSAVGREIVCPFAEMADPYIREAIEKMRSHYAQGTRDFVVVTHRNPDADSIAGCLGAKRLIEGMLPADARIRVLHDGILGEPLKSLSGLSCEPVGNLTAVLEQEASGRRVCIILVDQPTLSSHWVLPTEMRGSELIRRRSADIVFDHHGEQRLGNGCVIVPQAGSAAALIARTLQVAAKGHYGERSRLDLIHDARLALFISAGARIDACVSPEEALSPSASPSLQWLDQLTSTLVPREKLSHFALSNSEGENLERTCFRTARVVVAGLLAEAVADLSVAYAGIFSDTNSIGACATSFFKRLKECYPMEHPLAVVVFGLIRSPDAQVGDDYMIRGGQIVHFSVRTEASIDAGRIAQHISESGGGRDVCAGAEEVVSCDEGPIKEFAFVEEKLDEVIRAVIARRCCTESSVGTNSPLPVEGHS